MNRGRSLLLGACLSLLGTSSWSQTVTTLLSSGPPGEKFDLVVIGDGFTSGEQPIFDDFVRDMVLDGSFGEGPLWESMNAFNVYRINLDSAESGVTQLSTEGCFDVAFSTTYSGAPMVVATKTTRNGGDGGWLRRCDLDGAHVGLVVDEDKANDAEREHAAEQAGIVVFSRPFTAVLTDPSDGSTWRMEAGAVTLPPTTGTSGFQTVTLKQSYPTPPVVFSLASNEGADPSSLRIRNVSGSSFQVVQIEPPGSDGPHAGMTIHYVAVEPGSHRLPDGTPWEAGLLSTASVQHGVGVTGPTAWTNVGFAAAFGTAPTVLAEVQTMANETAAVPGVSSSPWLTAAVRNATATGAQLALERSEAGAGSVTSSESIGYLAVRRGFSGTFSDASGTVSYETLESGAVVQGWESVTVETSRNTALGWRYSGSWDRCWMEPGPSSDATLNAILDKYTPGWDYVAVVLNESGWGGCRRGSRIEVTLSSDWPVVSHELGHMVGNLADEYCGVGTFGGSEPGAVNVTANTNAVTLKWRDFVDPSTPVPTGVNASPGSGACTGFNQGTPPAGWTNDEHAGVFEGARYNDSGIFRPSVNGRMRGNSPAFCPVCYDAMKENMDGYHEYTFMDSYVGDFTGDGRDDVVIHNDNSLALYESVGLELQPIWIATGDIPLWDDLKPGDRFYVGDFNGDGRDDLYVFNHTDWAIPYFAMLRSTGNGFECVRRFDLELPGWDDMRPHDEFHVADFDGDGDDDIIVFNGQDWSMAYLQMLRSTGNSLIYAHRYDGQLPGWGDMRVHDEFYVGDFDRDEAGRDDLYVFNGRDWSVGYLEMLRSTGSSLQYVRRYDEELPGWDDMKAHDRFYVGDFDADGRRDLYVFNGRDWAIEYLQMLRSTGNGLANTRRFDGNVPGWDGLAENDQFYVADVNGDRRDDLYVVNTQDWNTEYLGTLRSTGTTLAGGWQADWIGSWNLGSVDRYLVGNFNGGAGWADLFVRNNDWFGMLRSHSQSVQMVSIYPRWIHRHQYHRLGWW